MSGTRKLQPPPRPTRAQAVRLVDPVRAQECPEHHERNPENAADVLVYAFVVHRRDGQSAVVEHVTAEDADRFAYEGEEVREAARRLAKAAGREWLINELRANHHDQRSA